MRREEDKMVDMRFKNISSGIKGEVYSKELARQKRVMEQSETKRREQLLKEAKAKSKAEQAAFKASQEKEKQEKRKERERKRKERAEKIERQLAEEEAKREHYRRLNTDPEYAEKWKREEEEKAREKVQKARERREAKEQSERNAVARKNMNEIQVGILMHLLTTGNPITKSALDGQFGPDESIEMPADPIHTWITENYTNMLNNGIDTSQIPWITNVNGEPAFYIQPALQATGSWDTAFRYLYSKKFKEAPPPEAPPVFNFPYPTITGYKAALDNFLRQNAQETEPSPETYNSTSENTQDTSNKSAFEKLCDNVDTSSSTNSSKAKINFMHSTLEDADWEVLDKLRKKPVKRRGKIQKYSSPHPGVMFPEKIYPSYLPDDYKGNTQEELLNFVESLPTVVANPLLNLATEIHEQSNEQIPLSVAVNQALQQLRSEVLSEPSNLVKEVIAEQQSVIEDFGGFEGFEGLEGLGDLNGFDSTPAETQNADALADIPQHEELVSEADESVSESVKGLTSTLEDLQTKMESGDFGDLNGFDSNPVETFSETSLVDTLQSEGLVNEEDEPHSESLDALTSVIRGLQEQDELENPTEQLENFVNEVNSVLSETGIDTTSSQEIFGDTNSDLVLETGSTLVNPVLQPVGELSQADNDLPESDGPVEVEVTNVEEVASNENISDSQSYAESSLRNYESMAIFSGNLNYTAEQLQDEITASLTQEIEPVSQRFKTGWMELSRTISDITSMFGRLYAKLQQVISSYDRMTSATARLSLQNMGGESDKDFLMRSIVSSQSARMDLTSFTEMTSRFANTGVFESNEQVSDFVETVAKTLKVSGATSAEVNTVMTQFSQAMAADRLSGDELRALKEAAPALIRGIAEELGTDIGGIKGFADKGLITREVMLNAVANMEKDMNEKFAKLPKTFEDISVSAQSQLAKFVMSEKGILHSMDTIKYEFESTVKFFNTSLGQFISGQFATVINSVTDTLITTFKTLGIVITTVTTALSTFIAILDIIPFGLELVSLALGVSIAGFILFKLTLLASKLALRLFNTEITNTALASMTATQTLRATKTMLLGLGDTFKSIFTLWTAKIAQVLGTTATVGGIMTGIWAKITGIASSVGGIIASIAGAVPVVGWVIAGIVAVVVALWGLFSWLGKHSEEKAFKEDYKELYEKEFQVKFEGSSEKEIDKLLNLNADLQYEQEKYKKKHGLYYDTGGKEDSTSRKISKIQEEISKLEQTMVKGDTNLKKTITEGINDSDINKKNMELVDSYMELRYSTNVASMRPVVKSPNITINATVDSEETINKLLAKLQQILDDDNTNISDVDFVY